MNGIRPWNTPVFGLPTSKIRNGDDNVDDRKSKANWNNTRHRSPVALVFFLSKDCSQDAQARLARYGHHQLHGGTWKGIYQVERSRAPLLFLCCSVLFEAGGRWYFLHGQKWLGNWDCSQSQFLLMISTTALDDGGDYSTVDVMRCRMRCRLKPSFFGANLLKDRGLMGLIFFPWKEKEILAINDWKKKKLHQSSYSPRHMWSWRWWPWMSKQELLQGLYMPKRLRHANGFLWC